jgi:hypothetical protein
MNKCFIFCLRMTFLPYFTPVLRQGNEKQTRRKDCCRKITLLPTSVLSVRHCGKKPERIPAYIYLAPPRDFSPRPSIPALRARSLPSTPPPPPLPVYETKLHERRFLVMGGWEVKTPETPLCPLVWPPLYCNNNYLT